MDIKKEELEKLYYSNTIDDLLPKLGISLRTLYKYLKACDIPLKGLNNAYKYRKKNTKKLNILN